MDEKSIITFSLSAITHMAVAQKTERDAVNAQPNFWDARPVTISAVPIGG